jgi:oxygen-independent coproporphyrinogen-3 oxidase
VYVHIPFCAARCGYCDFATWTDRHHLVEAYVNACVAHLDRAGARGDLQAASTVFFGGGTPSLLEPTQLARILGAVPLVEGAEVTVECNPDSVDLDKLRGYRRAGATRISLGVQSFRPHVLAFLDRTHEPANVERAVAGIRDAGFDTFNLDVIYGAPGESSDDWRASLAAALDLGPPHVSAYALTVEPGTPLGRAVAAGTSPSPDDDDQATKYAIADELLTAAGLESYEVSNWARPAHECRHNVACWASADYFAVGCAAHGHRAGRRWWNVRTPERYIERIGAGEDPIAGEELLDAPARAAESFVLAFRTRGGAAVPPAAGATVEDLAGAGLVTVWDGRVALTPGGRLLAGDLTARILAVAEWDGVARSSARAGTR